eukprot:s6646_g4.t1
MSDGPGARLLGSTHYLASRTEHVSHVVPVPVPGPPARVITQKVYVKHHPFECTEGYGSWKTQWSHEHQRYCCYKFKESCTTKVQSFGRGMQQAYQVAQGLLQLSPRNHYKTITHVHHVTVPEKVVVPAPPPREINHIVHVNHYKTITHVHHVTVPEKVVVPAPPPREINHIVHVPVHDPSPVIKIKTAGPPRVVKHYVTKKHYVPEPVPSPPTYHYKPEIPITKVQHVIQKRYYDCVAGIKNWHYGWSKTKKSWCCSHEQRGCPGTWQGDGLTKTIVTGVTQHIGHGHVHVIHHVHHYSTGSHDVDDLPDVIGDDDASPPPEYRHGDMSVGGDDDSLPPERNDTQAQPAPAAPSDAKHGNAAKEPVWLSVGPALRFSSVSIADLEA